MRKSSITYHEKKLKQHIEKLNEWGFDYVSGGEDNTKPMVIRCQYCGTEKTLQRDWVGRYNSGTYCKTCRHFETELREEQRRLVKHEESVKRRAIRKLNSKLKALIKLKTPKVVKEKKVSVFVCKECGETYEARKEKTMCPECYKKRHNSEHWHTRRATMMNALVDRDIDLKKVYERDNGICYICKCECDWNDYYMKGDTFIARGNYPSIDHVVPLSKGGKHSWDNVRLACRKCNCKKWKH